MMYPAITTTHAIPRRVPTSRMPGDNFVRCCYCAASLGETSDPRKREELQASHHCTAKSLAKKPAASVPYN